MSLWNNDTEIQFFTQELKTTKPEKLFYELPTGYFAYVPKGENADVKTLQSRNAPIGKFTEEWCKYLFDPIARKLGLHVVRGMVCEEMGLTNSSDADLAFCTTGDKAQSPENVKLIFEIKMSIIANYQYTPPYHVKWIGDYKTHKGNPSLLRSDSMLKAIGKSINIRLTKASTKTPIVILGNSPITDSYVKKESYEKV